MVNDVIWKPDYKEALRKKYNLALKINRDPSLAKGLKAYYATRPIEFIDDFAITYDPRLASQKKLTTMPFIMFPRQKELITFILECLELNEAGLIEKSRDMGATWVCVSLSVWLWLFVTGSSVGWGSRKEMLVDRIGDPDSIFEKIRMQLNALPRLILPSGFDIKKHSSYMKIVNPENGNSITGEAGDNIGRGGRKSIYFKDESAHYDHPERIEAALGDNTDVKIDISSVNGSGNIFHRKRVAGQEWRPNEPIKKGAVRVFILDWRDHPNKTQEWYNNRRAIAEREGLLHLFSQEVDRDYNACLVNLVIPKIWVNAAIDAHKILGIKEDGKVISAFDVADGGGDKNALVIRKGIVLRYVDQWAGVDVGESTRKVVSILKVNGCLNMQYDPIGVGSGVKAETNRLLKENVLSNEYEIVPWNAGAGVLFPNNRIIEGDKGTPKITTFMPIYQHRRLGIFEVGLKRRTR